MYNFLSYPIPGMKAREFTMNTTEQRRFDKPRIGTKSRIGAKSLLSLGQLIFCYLAPGSGQTAREFGRVATLLLGWRL